MRNVKKTVSKKFKTIRFLRQQLVQKNAKKLSEHAVQLNVALSFSSKTLDFLGLI